MPGTRDRRPRPARESGRPERPPRPADSLPLDERAIREHVDERSFRRGQDYARRGAISDARRQGNRLTGRCAGTSAPSYRVEATITGGRIAAADCECPVGEGGRCKHVAALLLTWRDDPARFREVRSLGDVLAGLSKEDLIALVGRMVEQRPELEALVEPSPADGDRTDVDSGPYREKAAAALLGDDWEVVPAVALSAVRSAGDRLLNRGEARRRPPPIAAWSRGQSTRGR